MCLLAWRSNALARTDSSARCESFRVFISRVSIVPSGPPGASTVCLGICAASSTWLCSGGGNLVVVPLVPRVGGSGPTAVVPRPDGGSEGRRFFTPSSRFFRLTMVLTNCFSSRSERVGTSLIIVLASTRGWRSGLVRRRWVGRKVSFISLRCSAPSCFGSAPCVSENALLGGVRRGGRSVATWLVVFDWVSTISLRRKKRFN